MNRYKKDDIPEDLQEYFEPAELGLESTPEEYINKLANIFDEVKRVLREDGTLWLNLGDTYAAGGGKGGHGSNSCLGDSLKQEQRRAPTPDNLKQKDLVGIPWRVAFELQRRGWYLRSDIIWHKRNPMPESVKDRPTSSHEYIFLLSKSKKYYYDNEAIKEPCKTNKNRPEEIIKNREYNYDSKLNKLREHKNLKDNGQDNHSMRKRRAKGLKDKSYNKKNKRDVWTINTKPFPKAHFAVYNRELIRPCIKAGCPEKICSQCKTPYERKTKTIKNKNRSQEGRTKSTKEQRMGKNPVPEKGWQAIVIDEGFHPNCECKVNTKGGIVLDPFMGAGTTALEALGQNKNFIGIDLNKEYINIAYERLVEHGYYEFNKYLPKDKQFKEKGLF